MHEDKLTPDQRLRLEALAQSIAVGAARQQLGRPLVDHEVIHRAKQFEAFIRGEDGE